MFMKQEPQIFKKPKANANFSYLLKIIVGEN